MRRAVIVSLVACFATVAFGQTIGLERDRRKSMLDLLKADVERNYFDPKFKGIDIEAKFKEAQNNVKAGTSVGQLDSAVAQFLAEFDDSHLFYLPPGKVNTVDYGFSFRSIGEKCYVTYVKKGSDAEVQGLGMGDELRSVSGFTPTRDSLWKLRYFFFILFRQPSLKLTVVKPDHQPAEYTVKPKIVTGSVISEFDPNALIRDSEKSAKRETRQYVYDKLPGAFIWRMPAFSLEPFKVDEMIDRAKKYPAIVFDLRGNGGGRVDMLQRLVGNLFSEDVKIGDAVQRKSTKEILAKSRSKDAYKGKVVVLIDSESASASEVFAKVIQLEKRGTSYGDRSAGAVMESKVFAHTIGQDIVFAFGASITIADLIMSDRRSLEKIGVSPDHFMIPGQLDLAAKRDVVMSAALQALGVEITPEAAYSFFPADEDFDR